MRALISLIFFSFPLNLWADSLDLQSFNYDGSQDSFSFNLKAEKSQLGTRPENRETICYGQEMSGYRTVCTGGYRPGELPPPSLQLKDPPRCWAEPVYAAVPYSCTQPFNVPYVIKEYDVDAHVSINFTKGPSRLLPNEGFKLILKGEELSLEVKASNKFLILKKENLKTTKSEGLKAIESQIDVKLLEAAPIVRGFQIVDAHMDQNKLIFTAQDKIPLDMFGLSLQVTRLKNVDGESALFSRELKQTELEFSTDGLSGRIDLDQLGVHLPSGKYELTLKTVPRFEGKILNYAQIPELFSTKILILKRR